MISIKEKVAYGLGDTASNFIFQTVMLFLTYYYTDIVGLNPATVGSMFLLVRLIDAVTDPLMGSLADRTRTRWGSYRPYLLWLALPFAIISVLAFTTPDTDYQGKLVYAVTSYIALMLMYTAINIPYCALGGVMTADPEQRVAIQSYRFIFAMIGGLIVTSFTLPLVDALGDGDDAKGYQLTMLLMGVVGMVLFLLCFAGTEERLKPEKPLSMPLSEQLKSVLRNDQCRVLCLVSVVLLTGILLRNSLAIYYVKYVLNRPEDVTLFVTIGMVGGLIGCAFAHPLAKKLGKIRLYVLLQIGSAIACVVNYFIPINMWIFALVIHFVWGFLLQMSSPLLWAKMADVADYGEAQSGVRLTGVTYSTVVFFIKVGVALGSAMSGWLLAFYGYEAGTVSEHVNSGIAFSFCILPALMSVLVVIIMRWYTLDTQQVEAAQQQIQAARLSATH